MEVVRFDNAPAYTAPNHNEIMARRLQGGEATGADFVLVGHSQFPPGATVPMEVAPIGRIYIVATGSISIDQADGVRHQLHQWDSVYVPPGEARAVVNESGTPAAILVVTPAPSK